jgi:hypothetical protein
MAHAASGAAIMARPIFRSIFVALTLAASSANPVTAGVAIDDIEMVIVESRFMGGMLGQTFTFHSHVLMKHGEIYRHVSAALEDLDIEALKKARPDGWGTWRRDGDAYVFTLASGKELRLKKGWYWRVHPGGKGDDLAGRTYSAQSGYADAALKTAVAMQRDINFLDGYRYVSGKFAGASAPRVVVRTEKNPEATGSYKISGYTIEFKPDKGEPHRRLFFYGDSNGAKDHGLISIGGTMYHLKK